MFRRSRGKTQYFTRQVSGAVQLEAPTNSAETFISTDGVICAADALIGVAATHMVKHIAISAISWTTDYVQTNGDFNLDGAVDSQQLRFGSEALYIDQLASGSSGAPVHSDLAFLNLFTLSNAVELDDMPLRIVHRRRFTIPLVNMSASTNFGANVSYINPGWGTERHIRRPIRLLPNQGLFWRVEIYDLPATPATGTQMWSFVGDILGAVSYRVVT